jgi:hypothetical protein
VSKAIVGSPSALVVSFACSRDYGAWSLAGRPSVLRDAEGRACRKHAISRTKHVIKKNKAQAEKERETLLEPDGSF